MSQNVTLNDFISSSHLRQETFEHYYELVDIEEFLEEYCNFLDYNNLLKNSEDLFHCKKIIEYSNAHYNARVAELNERIEELRAAREDLKRIDLLVQNAMNTLR